MPMGIYKGLWVFMGVYGYIWFSMGFCGSMGICGCLWVSMGVCVSLWMFMGIYECLWVSWVFVFYSTVLFTIHYSYLFSTTTRNRMRKKIRKRNIPV